MNYFAHGCRFVDRPYFLAGTAVPDWLRVSDKTVRVRSDRVAPFASEESPAGQVAAGILQHLRDDDLFHSLPAFIQVSSQLAIDFRRVLPPDDDHRPSFLGHIVTELILDGLLIEANADRLEEYYAAIQSLDPHLIQSAVNQTTKTQATNLARLIPLFHSEQFLRSYLTSEGLLYRLNQVMHRVRLPQLPPDFQDALRQARSYVHRWSSQLVPFPWPA